MDKNSKMFISEYSVFLHNTGSNQMSLAGNFYRSKIEVYSERFFKAPSISIKDPQIQNLGSKMPKTNF